MATFPRMHVSLYVKDIAQTVNFYTTFFAQPATKIKQGYAKYELDSPGLIISFVENPERVSAGFGHLGIQVESKEDVLERMSRLQSMKVNTREEMGTNCCYAVQDKFWAADPDGHQWEVYYFHEDAEFNDPRYTLTDQEDLPCCTPIPKEEKKKLQLADIAVISDQNCEPGSNCC
ncbi:MAG: catechol 2,3-dioxygenase-like lactoylglutathione lyase family enzyme [Sphingobacteriales bacterium]|jgi:catechol 2,3-dioxygenase-like lactoylglutathione lyase family enzyme